MNASITCRLINMKSSFEYHRCVRNKIVDRPDIRLDPFFFLEQPPY